MPNQILRAGRTFLVFGITAMLGVFVFLVALGSFHAPASPVAQVAAPQVPSTGKITLSPSPLTPKDGPADALAADTQRLFSDAPNATQDLAKKLAEEIIQRNPTGPGPAGAQRLNLIKPTEAVDKFLADSLRSFDVATILDPQIPDASIRIVDDSPAAAARYFKNFFTVISTDYVRNLGFQSDDQLENLVFANNQQLKRLYDIEVPKGFALFHKKSLAKLESLRRIGELISRKDDDPMRAMLALNVLEQTLADIAQTHIEAAQLAIGNNIPVKL